MPPGWHLTDERRKRAVVSGDGTDRTGLPTEVDMAADRQVEGNPY